MLCVSLPLEKPPAAEPVHFQATFGLPALTLLLPHSYPTVVPAIGGRFLAAGCDLPFWLPPNIL
jgi:hypothetical protein